MSRMQILLRGVFDKQMSAYRFFCRKADGSAWNAGSNIISMTASGDGTVPPFTAAISMTASRVNQGRGFRFSS